MESYQISSGLKMNIEKTKAYGFGIYENNTDVLGLAWKQEAIELLGITITSNEKDNFNCNYDKKLKLMHNILKVWARSNLSLKGKITVINSLIISLFVYPISITTTPPEVLEEIDSAIFKFLWSNKKPKIAKHVIQKCIKQGGLKMPNIYQKAAAWKIMWLKRALKNPGNNWVIIIDALLKDISFLDIIRSTPQNIDDIELVKELPEFYKDILNSWLLLPTESVNTGLHVQGQFIWNNKSITIEKRPIFWKRWYDKGIKYVGDLLDADSNFLDANDLNQIYGLKTNFLEVLQIRQAMPYEWRRLVHDTHSKPNMVPPITVFSKKQGMCLDLRSLKSKDIYWILFDTHFESIKPRCIEKWSDYIQPDEKQWEKIFASPFQACKETDLQSFQYRILHRVIQCNHWLYNIRVLDSPLCKKCNTDDTVMHYFIECDKLQNFWASFANWWCRLTASDINLTETIIIFGTTMPSRKLELLNFCLILAKKYISDSKPKVKDITLFDFLVILRNKIEEKHVYYQCSDRSDEFAIKWGLLYDNI